MSIWATTFSAWKRKGPGVMASTMMKATKPGTIMRSSFM